MDSGMDIEYKTQFEQIKNHDSERSQTWTGKRKPLTEKYGWAIPNHQALDAIASHGPLVSLGAGNGYWESLLEQMSVDTVALDYDPPPKEEQYTTVLQGTQKDVRRSYSDRTLLLVYPPPSSPMAREALAASSADTCVFVGEYQSSITGDPDFHHQLQSNWNIQNRIQLPSWNELNTQCIIFSRM